MKTVIRFIIKLNDGNKELKLDTNEVTWLEGGDNKVVFEALVDIERGKLLDQWEANGTVLQVSIEPKECGEIDQYGQIIAAECDQSLVDYNSQEGKARIEWTYNPTGTSRILLQFEGGEQ